MLVRRVIVAIQIIGLSESTQDILWFYLNTWSFIILFNGKSEVLYLEEFLLSRNFFCNAILSFSFAKRNIRMCVFGLCVCI